MGDDAEAMRHVADHPRLFEALLNDPGTAEASSQLFFFVVVRHTLKRIGVLDIELADYVAVVCADFGIPTMGGTASKDALPSKIYNIDWMEALAKARGHQRFFVHVHCANQFLVLTCLYPDFLHHRAQRRGAPDVDYYERVVADNLDAAGRHALAEEFAMREVLTHLSAAFPPVRRAMNHTLREYLNL